MKNNIFSEDLWSIEQVREYLFDCAKANYKWSRRAGFSAVILVLFPVALDLLCSIKLLPCRHSFIQDYIISKLSILLGLVSVVALFAHWFYFNRSRSYQGKAKEVSNLELMYNVYDRRKIRETIQGYLPEVKKLKETYDLSDRRYYSSPKEINAYQEVSYRILENCVWNAYLYKRMYRRNKWWLMCSVATIFTLYLILYSVIAYVSQGSYSIDLSAKLAYTIGLISTSSLSFNFLSDTLSSQKSVIAYEKLRGEILSREIDTGDKFAYIHNVYSHINLSAPAIKDSIYEENRDALNLSWKLIRKRLPQTDTILALKEVLPMIKHVFRKNGIKWAITGSTSYFLKHQPRYCRDIDIVLLNFEDVPKVNQILRLFLVEEVRYWKSVDIRSHYGRFNIGGVNVEVICEVENLTSCGCWVAHPKLDVCFVEFLGEHYPVTTKEYEQKVRNIMSMKKKRSN